MTKPANAATQNATVEESSGPDVFTTKCPVRINTIPQEKLQGVLQFEIGDLDWGRQGGVTKNGTAAGGGPEERNPAP